MSHSRLHGPSGQKSRIKESLRVTSAALVTTLTIAEKAIDGVPAPGLKAAVGGLLEIVKAAKKTDENAEDLRQLDVHLRDLSDVLQAITYKDEEDTVSDLDNRIVKLTSAIEEIVESCEHLHSQSSAIKFFANADHASMICGINQSIDRAIQTFQLGVGITAGYEITKIGRRLDRMAIHQPPQDPNDPLNIIRPYVADARYNSASRTTISRCFEGTRVDLLKKIYDWADDPNAKPIYWLCGLAGTGKSTIAQTVSEEFNQRKILGASFFFSRDVAERSNPYLLFTTVAYQLARFRENFFSQISTSIKKHPDACTSMLETQVEKLIAEPLRDVDDPPPVVVIVFDALDECSNEMLVQEMLILLAGTIPKLPFRTRVFITSRPDIHIRSKFHEHAMKSVSEASLLHDIDLSIVQHDIEVYLKHHLRKIGDDMLKDVRWPPQADINILVGRARGLFIYASASLAYIGDKGYREPKKRLSTLLADKPASKESPPYTEIDKLYRHILESSLPRVGAWGVASRLQPILGTIVMLLDPLPVHAMERLISANEGSILPMLNPLHAVLSVPDSPEELIRVFHKSFPDFMLDHQRCTDARLFIEPGKHHTRLALQCISIMNSTLRRNMCDIPDPSILNANIQDLGGLLEAKVGSHVLYACQFWASHLRHADPTDPSLNDALLVFVTTKLLYWLEILSLSRHVDTALMSLTIAQDWNQEEEPRRVSILRKMTAVLEPSSGLGQYLRSIEGKLLQIKTPVRAILYDCQCFVLCFLDVISKSAGHIYHSALPFTPHCLLNSQFEEEMHDTVKVLSKEDTWDPTLPLLKGHSDSVQSVSFSPDGLRIASGSQDRTVRLWDSTTGTHIRTLQKHAGAVLTVSFSPDGLRIASGSDDGTICLWDPATGSHVRTLRGHSGWVDSVCFSPDGSKIASGSGDRAVYLWDTTTGTQINALKGHSDWVRSVCFSPDGLRIASGSDDDTIRIWNSITGSHVISLEGHSNWVRSVCFSPDGLRIATGSADETVRLWDSITGAQIRTLKGHSGWIQSVCFSPDGLRIASGSHDGTIVLWDSTTGVRIRILKGHSSWVQSVHFSPDGLRLASGSGDMTVRLWDSITSTHAGKLEGHSHSVQSVNFSPNGLRIASGSIDGTVCLWETATGSYIKTLGGNSHPVLSICFSPDGLRIASACSDHTVCLWNSTTGRCIRVMKGHHERILSVCFSPDGQLIASGAADSMVILWGGTNGIHIKTLRLHDNSVRSVEFSLDGFYLRSKDISGRQFIWDCDENFKAVIPTLNLHSQFSLQASDKIVRVGSDLYLDDQSVIFPCRDGRQNLICILPFTDVSCYSFLHNYFIAGTKGGRVHILDFSSAVALLY